jgi:hypothetical protein
MRYNNFFCQPVRRLRSLTLIACTLFMVAANLPAADPSQDEAVKRGMCALPGSWVGEVDIGFRFFAQYSRGSWARGGPLAIEWILVDPTLFGNFPAAVRTTQSMGTWRMETAKTYSYTWVAYGLDVNGTPLYAIKTSGMGTIRDCHSNDFDWVLEVFPAPLDPLHDEATVCLAGTGTKERIPIESGICE